MNTNILGLREEGIPFKRVVVFRKFPGNSAKIFRVTAAATLILSAMLTCEKVQAADDAVPLMDKVIVTASRQEETIASVPANVTVISEQEITNSPAETVPELLRYTPGIVVNDITGNGRNIKLT